jgi:hypothetical protein
MSRDQNASPATDDVLAGSEILPLGIHQVLQQTLHTLSNIDFEHKVELEKLEQSRASSTLKKKIAERLRAKHRERREPYVQLIAELREQGASSSGAQLKATG